MKNRARAIVVVFFFATLSACASSTTAVYQSLQFALRNDRSAALAPLNPSLRYLRVTIDGRVALMVLGYVEKGPQGPIEVWYSAEREVLRLQNGRIVGAVGLTTEWRNVGLSPSSSWAELKRSQGTATLVRSRDVMPGYKFGIRDVLAIRAAAPPERSALVGLRSESLDWFEERIEADGDPLVEADHRLPLSRYAVAFEDGGERVVYGEQCLGPKLCFTWQRWPAVSSATNASR